MEFVGRSPQLLPLVLAASAPRPSFSNPGRSLSLTGVYLCPLLHNSVSPSHTIPFVPQSCFHRNESFLPVSLVSAALAPDPTLETDGERFMILVGLAVPRSEFGKTRILRLRQGHRLTISFSNPGDWRSHPPAASLHHYHRRCHSSGFISAPEYPILVRLQRSSVYCSQSRSHGSWYPLWEEGASPTPAPHAHLILDSSMPPLYTD